MAMLFTDSFDSYSSTADLTKKWQTVQTPWAWVAGAGRFGGGAAQATGGSSGNKLAPVINLSQTNGLAFGFWIKISNPPSASTTLFAVMDATGAVASGAYLALNADGTIQMNWPFGGSGLRSPASIADNQWHWIEWEELSASTRRLIFDNINQIGTSDAHAVGIGTGLSFFFNSIAGVTITVDDVLYYDVSAGNPNANTSFPLSTRQITVLRPISDAAVNFATLSAGTTHYNLVNEVNPDGDTSYCEDGTSGHQDLFNMSALGFTPANITTVMTNIYIKTGVPGTISHEAVCKSGSATGTGPSTVTPNVYFTLQASFPTDPNTGTTWTAAGLAASQWGYKCP